MPERTHSERLRSTPILRAAWRHIRSNGLSSLSPEIVNEVRKFEEYADINLARIGRQLRENRFKFAPGKGVFKTKPGKTTKRPLVVSPIENRIVQRAILEVLQEDATVSALAESEYSFGGVKKGGVQPAIEVVYRQIHEGGDYFVRSDITAFFDNIPKDVVLKIVESHISDKKFLDVFRSALAVELSNLAQLGSDADRFPIHEIGVAQGCCLSPFVGNLLLHEFDKAMNCEDVICVRYIDDFILLAPNFSASRLAFKKANELLGKFGLQAYDPKIDKGKAEQGSTFHPNKFSFLGCEIRPGTIRPDKKSVNRIKTKITGLLDTSYSLMANPAMAAKRGLSLADTLQKVSNMIHSWSKQYSFCNDQHVFAALDKFVDCEIGRYLAGYSKRHRKMTKPADRRHLLGVKLASHADIDKSIPHRYHSR